MYSFSRFLKDSLNKTAVQEDESNLVADGAYSGKANRGLADKKISVL